MAKKRGRPPKDQSKTAVESASATSNPSTASTLVDKEKMAQIIFEARYLIGINVDRASRSKTHLCNKHNISIPTYYVWEKKLERSHPTYDPEFERMYKEIMYEFFTQEDNTWLIKSRQVYTDICDMMQILAQRMQKEISEGQPLNSSRLSAISHCQVWGLRSQEAYLAIKDIEETNSLITIGGQN